MASTNLHFDDQSHHGRLLRSALHMLEGGHEALNDAVASMNHMKDGDGSQAAHFAEVTSRFGFVTDAKAKAGYDELNSVLFKLNTDSSVTDMNAALLQAFAKFR
jgi:hypothetical protein